MLKATLGFARIEASALTRVNHVEQNAADAPA